jgi:hypothetical protein
MGALKPVGQSVFSVIAACIVAIACAGTSGCGQKSAPASDGGDQRAEEAFAEVLQEAGADELQTEAAASEVLQEAGADEQWTEAAADIVQDVGGPPPGAVACDDGTGALDCCPADTGNGTCAEEGLRCWSRCAFATPDAQKGTRQQSTCTGGLWSKGHGVFPCDKAAGP